MRSLACRLVALVALPLAVHAQTPRAKTQREWVVPVIPNPVYAAPREGAWAPPRIVTVGVSDASNAELVALAPFAVEIAKEGLGGGARADVTPRAPRGAIHLRLGGELARVPKGGHRVTISARGAEVASATPEGIFHGLQTLRQLLLAAPRGPQGRAIAVNAVLIEDAPRFGWRGLHLDVGRHFRSAEFVKRYIDLMARFKLNTFHWHLTEDQGWRIEIKKYPRLTEVGGCRSETMIGNEFNPPRFDGVKHCGFYTQEEIRDVVAYAKARYITVVPEIEMPGHSVAALAAYPELACKPGPYEVRKTWGVDENILCPSEQTFTFLQDVLTEVMALFPSTFIHIGGDEAPKTVWKASELAQGIIKREGLKDEHELQSWFVRRIERFLASNGRRLIGWDEILEGGLAPGATVMSWRGTSGGIEAARAGHDVVMTPTSHMYFDFYQGDPRFEPLAIGGRLPLEQVYSYEPIPIELDDSQAKHVLGAQGNLWTEYLKTEEAVEYMAWPRALALAEVTWSAKVRRDWDSFIDRLPTALKVLDNAKVNYRLPAVEGLSGDQLTLAATATVRLRTPLSGAVIRYTLDGSDPTATSTRYTRAFTIPVTEKGVTVTARAFTPEGKASPPRAATFMRTTLRGAAKVDPTTLRPGLKSEYVEAMGLRRVTQLDTLPVLRMGVAPIVARPSDARAENYGVRLAGYLRVPKDGIYSFILESDDGSTLSIGESIVVNHDGAHGAEEKVGMVALKAGLHPLGVKYFQAGGGAALSLKMKGPDGKIVPVEAPQLFHQP